MNLDELRSVRAQERRKDSLQELRDSFYGDVAAYIAELKQERARAAERADDPFSSPEVSRLSDEVDTAEEVLESIYERRVGKVVKLASFAASGRPVDEAGMTTEERALFDDLVERIEENKTRVLETLVGGADATSVDVSTGGDASSADAPPASASADDKQPSRDVRTDATSDDAPPTPPPDLDAKAADEVRPPEEAPPSSPDAIASDSDAAAEDDLLAGAMGSESDARSDGGEDQSAVAAGPTSDTGNPATTGASLTDRTTVRITRDVGRIFGVDEREYDLAREDVVALPEANAQPLLERDAAERLE